MSTILKVIYRLTLPAGVLSESEKRADEINFGARKFDVKSLEYSYPADKPDPYGLKDYFSPVLRGSNIKLYQNDGATPRANILAEIEAHTKYDSSAVTMSNITPHLIKTKIKGKGKGEIEFNGTLPLKYIIPNNILNTTSEAQSRTSKLIAERLGKTGTEYFDSNTGIYKPSPSEVIMLTHILLSEIGSKGSRRDVQWQREKAAILWCVINAVKHFKSVSKIEELLPGRGDTTKFKYYLNDDTELYGSANLDILSSERLKGKGLEKYKNAQKSSSNEYYNFELFIDAFFAGYFPDETNYSTNWSHRNGLQIFSGQHLPNGFLHEGKPVVTSEQEAYTLDGNIILTKNNI